MSRKSTRSLWAAKLAGKLPPSQYDDSLLSKKSKKFEGLVLGIDPSLRGTGLALLSFSSPTEATLIYSQTVRLKRSISLPQCLAAIASAINTLTQSNSIRHVAIEQTIYVQNFQTAQILGAARGAAITAAALQNIPIFEYAPLRIKQAVVGFGRAGKEQVARTIMQHLCHTQPLPSDEADAASAALCHALTWRE